MKVVITGGKGFVGQHLIHELEEAWPMATVAAWDLPEIDITRPETYHDSLAQLKPEWVVHLAGLAAVGPSSSARDTYMAVNAHGTETLLAAVAADSPDTRVLAISSADIYGLTERAKAGQAVPELPLSQCRPGNPYAESKLAMEQMIEEKFLDRVIRVRPFPHFGPKQKTGFVAADFASQIVNIERHAPREAPPGAERSGVLRVGNLTTKRDFTDVRDVVRAYRLLLEKGEVGDVYNVGSGTARPIQEILDRLLALSKVAIRVEQDPGRLRPTDVPILLADTTKLRELTGWRAEISLDQSLQDILDDWRARS